MCGIFGVLADSGEVDESQIRRLASLAKRRGSDSSGFISASHSGAYNVVRADDSIDHALKLHEEPTSRLFIGHSRLVTNGMHDNQPVERDGLAVLHNGIITNPQDCWRAIQSEPSLEIDSEVIAAICSLHVKVSGTLEGAAEKVLHLCRGSVSAAVLAPSIGQMIVFSNTGSLFLGTKNGATLFASEASWLKSEGATYVRQIRKEVLFSIPEATTIDSNSSQSKRLNLLPSFNYLATEEAMLEFATPELVRCNKCVLPHTMPFIEFNVDGVCNYCTNYEPKNNPKPFSLIEEVADRLKRSTNSGAQVVVPFSGGRDSSYALHVITEILGLKAVAYTYDWGMVTDLGRRNISLMCGELGVENIVIAADISKKRKFVRKNLEAWLARPHLGMVSLLTAGDKHFYRYVNHVKAELGLTDHIWGVNPLETTHFKAGFLGIGPKFSNSKVYRTGWGSQFNYHSKRGLEYVKNPKYFNSSIFDTLSGEYYRSIAKKTGYHHLFDYLRWDESEINETLLDTYGWEVADDTSTTWRIGDGTAGLYNYIYYTVAGFSEHDTFRSNQVREGDITREMALELVAKENRPRYTNIKWYLEAVGASFPDVVKKINLIPKIY